MGAGTVARPGALVPVLVAVLALAGALLWLGLRGPGDRAGANLIGAAVFPAAVLGCLRVSRAPGLSAPARSFWQLWALSAAALLLSSIAAATAALRHHPGRPLYEAVPTLLSLNLVVVAFRHVPLDQRTRIDWGRLLLDGAAVAAAVAVAGKVFFG